MDGHVRAYLGDGEASTVPKAGYVSHAILIM